MTLATLGQLHALLLARGVAARLVGDAATPVERVHSDTRTLRAGDLFVALRGERFNAHSFLPQARAAGAAAALAEHGVAEAGLAGLEVPDSLAALQQLGAAWRRSLPVALAAVTGSNGKTTCTQMIAAILRAWLGDGAHATRGNLNTHIGVSLTLLGLAPQHRAGVVELGTNHPGEIGALAPLVAPQVLLVTNAQREHQEFLQGLDAVVDEHASAIASLDAAGTLVLPAHDAATPTWRARAGQRHVVTFALAGDGQAAERVDGAADATHGRLVGEAAWHVDHWQLAIGPVTTRVHIAGRHNARNAVAAAAVARALGAPDDAIARGLAAFRPVGGRSRTLQIDWQGQRSTLVDDAYNANPDSVLAAIDVLAELPGPRWLVLGDMGEVGAQGPSFHEEVGRHAARRGIEHVWTCGRIAGHTAAACGGRAFADRAALLQAIADGQAPAARSVLVKGARSMGMEHVVQALAGTGLEDAHAA